MRVLVGLSGGVDSAIAAYLLKEAGHDVVCAFMRNWDSYTNNDILGNPSLDEAVCTQEKDYEDALMVATQLGLKLERVDYIQEYWDNVFQTFLDEYAKGRTPNPDILCNKYIKFDAFFQYALTHSFDALATGHYAKVVHGKKTSYLYKAQDGLKDQSYFLCQISQEALAKTIFPLGDLNKTQVRDIAEKLNLKVAHKKDSTGICFIGERNFRQFLSNYLPMKNGNILNLETKEVIGQHKGVLYYTLGQRKGLDISSHRGPWFVVGKDIYKNELYVVKGEDNPWLFNTSCSVTELNWFNPLDLTTPLNCTAKFRYRQADQRVRIQAISKDEIIVSFPQGIKAIVPGQEAVFYDGEICLGGGKIDVVYQNNIDVRQRVLEALS